MLYKENNFVSDTILFKPQNKRKNPTHLATKTKLRHFEAKSIIFHSKHINKNGLSEKQFLPLIWPIRKARKERERVPSQKMSSAEFRRRQRDVTFAQVRSPLSQCGVRLAGTQTGNPTSLTPRHLPLHNPHALVALRITLPLAFAPPFAFFPWPRNEFRANTRSQ